MMWTSLANFRENISQIAAEVLDTQEELEASGSFHGSSFTEAEERPSVSLSDDDEDLKSGELTSSRSARKQKSYNKYEANGDGPWTTTYFKQKLGETEQQLERMQTRDKELSSQLLDKEKTYLQLKEDHGAVLLELNELKESLFNTQAELAETKSQLQREREAEEGIMLEYNAFKKKFQASEELASKSQDKNNSTIMELQMTISELEKERNLLAQANSEFQMERKRWHESLPLTQTDGDYINEDSQLVMKQMKLLEASVSVEREKHKEELESLVLQRDKALRDLNRLKQHLLDKERADSEKMDNDSERIEALQAAAVAADARIRHLEAALFEAAEVNRQHSMELERKNEENISLQQKLRDYVSALESKNIELVNLQGVLGQYYAESEAKERLRWELRCAKEENTSLSKKLKVAADEIEDKERQKSEISEKLAVAEGRRLEIQEKMQKLEDDVTRLRHALEQSMTRLNRMSSDSDYYVDRRIVIKLLVTYFERRHSQEVLDLMARMLGFSDDDKRRVGLAQKSSGKGVVRSVLGLPGRFVGGMLGSSADTGVPSLQVDNQSFADLWIDFLLKESEERDRREKAELEQRNGPASSQRQEYGHSDSTLDRPSNSGSKDYGSPSPYSVTPGHRPSKSFSGYSSLSFEPGNQPPNTYPNSADTEFSTVPLNSANPPSINTRGFLMS